LAVLHDYLAEQLRRTDRAGKDRLFGRSAGEVFYASTIDGRAKRAWRAHNAAEREAASEAGRAPELLTLLTMHECRHTFASLLIDAGVNPKAIQEFMGHATIEETFSRYGHLMPGARDQARVLVDAYIAAALKEAAWNEC
jgi:integrase